MKFSVITLFPQMIEEALQHGVVGQALKKNLFSLEAINPRQFTSDVHRTVDDRPFGGGDGMVMLYEPLKKSLESINERGTVIYLSPQGPRLTDAKVREISKLPAVTLLCGRYGGVDQRFLNEFVDEEISIGDYVLSGGEIGALALIDSVARFIPGVLGDESSALKDSVSCGYLEAPLFTRPREFVDEKQVLQKVPDVLLSGNHALIEEWRGLVGLLLTLKKRPDLLQGNLFYKEKCKSLNAFWKKLSSEDKKILGLEDFPPLLKES